MIIHKKSEVCTVMKRQSSKLLKDFKVKRKQYRFKKKKTKSTKTERYYTSSIAPTLENVNQKINSIGVRWYYET